MISRSFILRYWNCTSEVFWKSGCCCIFNLHVNGSMKQTFNNGWLFLCIFYYSSTSLTDGNTFCWVVPVVNICEYLSVFMGVACCRWIIYSRTTLIGSPALSLWNNAPTSDLTAYAMKMFIMLESVMIDPLDLLV